jgi:hypothetical protein
MSSVSVSVSNVAANASISVTCTDHTLTAVTTLIFAFAASIFLLTSYYISITVLER